MNILRKTAHIYALEGAYGVAARAARKLLGRPQHEPACRREAVTLQLAARQECARQQEAYLRQVEAFTERTRELGLADECDGYYWYHTIDLGDGLVTPGDYDFRSIIQNYPFPADMSGMHVLDVGSATGYFAFEFERRGAQVVSVELPSLACWDLITVERETVLNALMAYHGTTTIEEATRRHLHGPFEFCRRRLGSKVRRCYSTVYDLSLAKLDAAGFDLVFLGDVLPHLFSPLQALDALASVCRGSMILSFETVRAKDESTMHFVGQTPDCRSWWRPNLKCICDMLRRTGFSNAEPVARINGCIRRTPQVFRREIVVAQRSRPSAIAG